MLKTRERQWNPPPRNPRGESAQIVSRAASAATKEVHRITADHRLNVDFNGEMVTKMGIYRAV